MQHLVGSNDDQHVQAPAHERLRRDQSNQQPRSWNFPNRPEPPPELVINAARTRSDMALHRHAKKESSGNEKGCCSGGKDRTHVGEHNEQSSRKRTNQRAKALNRRGRSVRSDQVLRSRRKRRKNRLQSRPEERRANPDRCRSAEDHHPATCHRSRRRNDKRGRSQQRDRKQKPLPPEAITERRRKRRNHRRRQQTHKPRNPTAVVPPCP